MNIDVAELDDARAFLGAFAHWQLGRLAGVLLPAAEVGAAGPYSLLVLELIGEEIGARLQVAA